MDSLLVLDKGQTLLGVVWLEELIGKREADPIEYYISDDYIAVEGETSLKEIIATIDYDVSGIIPVIQHDRKLLGYLTKSIILAYTLMDYFSIYVEEWDSLLEEFLRHLAMTSFSVVLALIIAVPLGIFITRNKAVSNVVIGIANVMQSIPCMALLAMGIPFLGVGETLAIFMVFVYAFLPILKNTYTGISGISPVSMEVARGIGLTRMQQLRRVELPMAMPYIMSGIRIAAVSSVGTMTIAAFAGANGLGSFIQLGMNSLNYPMTIMGAVAAALMALTLDFLLGRVERAFTSEGLLPQDQIKNLSLSVRSRRKAMAAALCGALLVVSVASYASIIA